MTDVTDADREAVERNADYNLGFDDGMAVGREASIAPYVEALRARPRYQDGEDLGRWMTRLSAWFDQIDTLLPEKGQS